MNHQLLDKHLKSAYKELFTTSGTEKMQSYPCVAHSPIGEKAKYTNNETTSNNSRAEVYKMLLLLSVFTIRDSV